MAFTSAIQLMAFASVTQASAGAEGPANALLDKPTASATVPQRRILNYYPDYRRNYGNRSGRVGEQQWYNGRQIYDQSGGTYILNGRPFSEHQSSCEFNSDCGFIYQCKNVEIYRFEEAYGEMTTSYTARRCEGRHGFEGVLQNHNWGLPLLVTFLMSSVTHLVAFLSGLPSRWTRGDYSTLSAILLQLGSTAYGFYDVIRHKDRHDLRVSAVALLVSYPFLLLGIRSASKQRVMRMTTTKIMIGMAFFILIPGLFFGNLAISHIKLFGSRTHWENAL